ncbi:hypothetical protein [Streptomyces glaucescens]|uniref:hypothetical protein n=1 Tax=Streptomyces glaucescens TaxID=1907 RepID=UPI000A36D948|nr:hypothetical protein [Streptomyces glaucescens]
MTEITPSPAVPSVSAEEAAAFEVMGADAVSAGWNMSAGAYIAGLLAAGQAATAPSPKTLLADRWPDVDPAVAYAIYERGLEAGWRGAQFYAAPRLHRETLAALKAQLEETGFHAMAGLVGRSREVVVRSRPVHPVDGEGAGGH